MDFPYLRSHTPFTDTGIRLSAVCCWHINFAHFVLSFSYVLVVHKTEAFSFAKPTNRKSRSEYCALHYWFRTFATELLSGLDPTLEFLSIEIAESLGFFHHTKFRKLDPSSDWGQSFLTDPTEEVSPTPSPVDGKKLCFRNFLFFRVPRNAYISLNDIITWYFCPFSCSSTEHGGRAV
jgi:hypothetical protein